MNGLYLFLYVYLFIFQNSVWFLLMKKYLSVRIAQS